MRERRRDNADLAADLKSGKNPGAMNLILIAQGDDRFMIETGAPFKAGDLVGIKPASGQKMVRRSDAEGRVALQAGDQIIGRADEVVFRRLR